MSCRYCGGRGRIPIEPGSSTTYPCPDCSAPDDDDAAADDSPADELQQNLEALWHTLTRPHLR
jgi:hypothetical protein